MAHRSNGASPIIRRACDSYPCLPSPGPPYGGGLIRESEDLHSTGHPRNAFGRSGAGSDRHGDGSHDILCPLERLASRGKLLVRSFGAPKSPRSDFGNALGASRDRLLGTMAGAVLTVSFLSLARIWSIPGLLLLGAIVIPLSYLAALRPQYRTALVTVHYRPVGWGAGHNAPRCHSWQPSSACWDSAPSSAASSHSSSPLRNNRLQDTSQPQRSSLISVFSFLCPAGQAIPNRRASCSGTFTVSFRGFPFVARLRNPEVAPIVRILTRVYWGHHLHRPSRPAGAGSRRQPLLSKGSPGGGHELSTRMCPDGRKHEACPTSSNTHRIRRNVQPCGELRN